MSRKCKNLVKELHKVKLLAKRTQEQTDVELKSVVKSLHILQDQKLEMQTQIQQG